MIDYRCAQAKDKNSHTHSSNVKYDVQLFQCHDIGAFSLVRDDHNDVGLLFISHR